MNLKDQLLRDLQLAMKTQDIPKRNTLRLLRAALNNAEIEEGHPLSDAEGTEILSREAKRRREAIDEYIPLGRQDKVDEARIELKIIEEYLPEQLGQEEIEAMARKVIAESGVIDSTGIGKVMRRLMPQLKGRADGRLVSQIVFDILKEEENK
jgi:uncharacterized protein YqeY